MADEPVGCAKPTGKVLGGSPDKGNSQKDENQTSEVSMEKARVGGQAPDFEAPAYHKGQFTSVKLSEHLGKWVLLCFYPGDFTFV